MHGLGVKAIERGGDRGIGWAGRGAFEPIKERAELSMDVLTALAIAGKLRLDVLPELHRRAADAQEAGQNVPDQGILEQECSKLSVFVRVSRAVRGVGDQDYLQALDLVQQLGHDRRRSRLYYAIMRQGTTR